MRRPFIMVAPTGARRGTADHPALPLTPEQIATDAAACQVAGADAIHLHVRDGQGRHTLDAGLYREALNEVALRAPGLLVQVSTEAGGRFDVAAQLDCVTRLRPEWASVSVREMARAPDLAERLYGFADEIGCRVQHILYDAEDVALLIQWQAAGIVRGGLTEVIHVIGGYGSDAPSDPAEVSDRLALICTDRRQMVCAFGPQEHACLLVAAKAGADLRVGFENSLTAPDGRPWSSNAASVAALVTQLEAQDNLTS